MQKCRRDTGLIVDAAYYDIALGTNYNAVTTGLAYRRAMSADVIDYQLIETLGAIAYAGEQAAVSVVSNATAVSRSAAAFAEILDIIEYNVAAADAVTFSDTGVANKTNARAQLQTNRAFIQQELIDWIDAQIAGDIAPFSTSLHTILQYVSVILDTLSTH